MNLISVKKDFLRQIGYKLWWKLRKPASEVTVLKARKPIPMVEPSESHRPPLGLPSGSVRALLTLLIVAVVISLVVREKEVEPLWVETLMIALAHYFTARRFINLTPAVRQRLEAEGHVEAEAHPLYLPRHSIRVILMLAFVGLAVYLHREGRLFQPQALSILGVVFSYVFGVRRAKAVLILWVRDPSWKAGWPPGSSRSRSGGNKRSRAFDD